MIGIDTNVLVRYLAQDDPEQSKIASDFIENKCDENNPAFLNHVVLCETIWVLERLYDVNKKLMLEIIEKILNTEHFRIYKIEIVWRAFQEFKLKNADFADCLLAQINIESGCKETMTFDKAASKTSGYKLY